MKNPKLYVVAGPNGAGKTTFAKKFLPMYARCYEFVNTDLIAAGIAPLRPETASVAAGRLMLTRMSELAAKHADFAFETTLSGRSYMRFFRKLQKSGYEVHLFYLWIPAPALALRRIAERVKSGGHDVPKPVVIRRFFKSLRNLFRLYWDLPSTISLINNSSAVPRLIASKHGPDLHILDSTLLTRIRSQGYEEKKGSKNKKNSH